MLNVGFEPIFEPYGDVGRPYPLRYRHVQKQEVQIAHIRITAITVWGLFKHYED